MINATLQRVDVSVCRNTPSRKACAYIQLMPRRQSQNRRRPPMTVLARLTLAAAAAAATVAVLAGTYVEVLNRALPMHFV